MITLNKKFEIPIKFEDLPIGAWFYQYLEDGDILLGIKTLPFNCHGEDYESNDDQGAYNAITRFVDNSLCDDNYDDDFKDFLPDYCPRGMTVIQINTVDWE